MKKMATKLLSLLLAAMMIVGSVCVPAGAKVIQGGENEKTIYLSTKVTDTAGNQITSVLKDSNFLVELNFAGNPTTLSESIQGFDLFLKYDEKKMTPKTFANGLVQVTGNEKYSTGIVKVAWANQNGLYVQDSNYNNVIQASGTLTKVVFTASVDLTTEDLATFQYLTSGSGNELANVRDGNTKKFTLVQTPALEVTVNGALYDTSTAEEIKNALTVQYVNVNGEKTPVSSFTVDKTSLSVGDNEVTVTASGISETIKIAATQDTVASIAVTTQPKLNYTSGDKFDLSGMVVTATYASGKTKAVTDYSTSIAAATEIKVASHNNQKITVTVGDKTTETNALTVNPITVAIPTATGKYTYTGVEQTFTYSSTDSDNYTVSGALTGTNAGEYRATATLGDKTETKWSDGTIENKTLTWVIAPNTDVLTVTLNDDANSFTYDGQAKTPAVTVKSGDKELTVNSDYTLTYSNNTNAGTATITAEGKGNYAGAEGSTTFVIKKATINPTVSMTGWTYGMTASEPSVLENTGGGDVAYTYYTDESCTAALAAKPEDAGTYWVKATVAETSNYAAATTGAVCFTIGKATAPTGIIGTISLYHADKNSATLAVSSLTGVPAGWKDEKFENVGTLSDVSVISTISVTDDGHSLSYTPTGNAGSGKTATVTATVSSKNHEGATVAITFTTVDINIDWAAIETDYISLKAAPVYGDKNSDVLTIKNANYTARTTVDVPGTLSVKDANSYPTAGTTSVMLVFTPNSKTGISGTFEHTYTITAVARKNITVTIRPVSVVYGEAIPTAFDVAVPSGALVGSDAESDLALNLSTTATAGSSVGGYNVTGTCAAANYDVTVDGAGALTITAKPLTNALIEDINAVTYNGAAQEPTVTVKHGNSTLTQGTDYTVSYKNNTNAGTATVTVTGTGNYKGIATKDFTINKANISASAVTLATKTYDGTTGATVSGVTFAGLVNNETLALGTDYTATAAYSSANAGTSVSATGTVTLGSTTAAKNYNLTNGGFATSGTIDKATTTLSLSAADTVYTGAAYAGTITATSNVTTTPTYTYYTNEECTAEVSGKPVNAGTYWVKGVIAESTNNTAAEAKASFTIAKAPLTIKANDKTITYGDAPADNGVTYDGFVGGEGEPVVATKATYTYDYTQYGDVGTYAVKPTGAVAANYAITYQSGKLTVEKKPVNLTWSDTSSLYYDGAAKDVTAAVTAGNLVNDDVIGVAVVGGKATEIGSYIAKATALTGEKSENYALPANATKEYSIVSALRSVTVSPTTVTAVIDGLTVKLVGYASGDVSVSAENGTIEGDKLTVGGVTYTVDKSGVVSIPAAVDVKTEQTSITKAGNIGNDVFSQINDTSKTKSAGLNAAAATKIAAAEKTISESDKSAGAVKVEVQVTLSIQPMTYADGKLKLDITPEIQYTYVKSDGSAVRTAEKETLSNSDIKASVTISVKLPNEFNPNYAKHSLGGGLYEYLPVTITDGVATWQQSSFSEVELISDSRSAAITFQMNDKSIVTKTYTPANVGEALPTDSKSGYALKGWKLENGETVYTGTLTDTMLDSLGGKTLVGVFAKSWDGYSGYSGYTTTTCDVSVDKTANGTVGVSPKNASKGATVTITTTPDKGWTLETLTVLDKDGKEVELDIVKIGEKYTFKMPSGNVTVKATFMEDNTMLNYFVDVNAQDYFYDAVLWAAQERITSGTDALHFSPSDPCTRAQIVTFLWRAAGSPVAKDTNSFTDVPSDAYYAKAVAWAIENGITNGTSDSTFGPDETCTRAQAVTFLARTLGGKAAASAAFSDVPAGSWYAEAVAWAAENGITTGIGGGLFGSGDNCTRAQIVTFLWRAYGK